MRLGELISLARRDERRNGDAGYAADLEAMVSELADDDNRPAVARRRRPMAGGLVLLDVDVETVLRAGLGPMIEAHRIVEGQREQSRAISRRERAEAEARRRDELRAARLDFRPTFST